MGTVPPFGHSRQLPVLVDSAITAYATCYAGAGSEDAEIFLEVPELLQASAATVADVSKPGAAAAEAGEAAPLRQQAAAAAAALPLPWQPGQEQVELLGVIAHRRKIAKLLLFANLVPLGGSVAGGFDGGAEPASAVAPAARGTSAFLRRLWRHPVTGAPCEVQLIMGQTLERRLGRWGAPSRVHMHGCPVRQPAPEVCDAMPGMGAPIRSRGSGEARGAAIRQAPGFERLVYAPALTTFPPHSPTARAVPTAWLAARRQPSCCAAYAQGSVCV